MSRARSRIRRWVLRLSAALGTLLLVMAALVWWLLQASLPKLDGTVELAGLNGAVEIVRDRYAIPQIRAEHARDVVFALGFVHAQDRLFQMELTRRTGAGRLSEVMGERALPADRFLRTLGLYRHAEASVAALSPVTRAWLEAYAAGVNAFLQTEAWPPPPEFLLLRHFDLEPWTPADSLVVIKLMALTLDTNLWDEVRRAQLEARLPADEVAELWPATPPGSPVTLRGWDPGSRPGGSNVWTVDGRHSTTGAPLLANDPHLGLQTPGTFYLARLETPDVTLTGATLPGVPGITIGHNGHVAWGFTTPGIDTQDLFIERPDPSRPGHYHTPEGSLPFEIRKETIEVRGAEPVALTVRTTRHGPVISDVRPEFAALAPEGVVALAWTALSDDDTTLEALHRANLATDRASFREALRLVVAPAQNVAYADPDGIAFATAGRVPVRTSGHGVRPVPGWDGRHNWTGWLPFEALPSARDPAGGTFINANNQMIGRGYPHFLAADWPPAFRARRITQMIQARATHDLESFARIQNDVLSILATDLLPALDQMQSDQAGVSEALERLKAFDGEMSADAPGPLLFAAWYRRISEALLGEVADDFRRGRPQVVVQALKDCTDCSDMTTGALTRALDDLETAYGEDPEAWRWGQAHMASMPHPVLQHVPLIGRWVGIEVPSGGDGATVNVGHFDLTPGTSFASTHAASFRGLYDLADLEHARFVLPTGQSGHPLSPHRADLTDLWAQGRTIEINAIAIEAPAARAGTLWLRPQE